MKSQEVSDRVAWVLLMITGWLRVALKITKTLSSVEEHGPITNRYLYKGIFSKMRPFYHQGETAALGQGHSSASREISPLGPYPLGDFGKIGAIIGAIMGGQQPIIVPATPCVWPKITRRWETTDLYQACLIFHCQLVSQRWPSPNDQSALLSIV